MITPGQTVLVVGLGKSGVSSCEFLLRRGCRVRATEHAQSASIAATAQALAEKGVTVETGGHTEEFCPGARRVVVSPGVPESAVPIQWAKRFKIPVIGEL
ncbi:MAG: UDP-N-acetylmuramoyl-L-alanine--D-glutamate ligase, partial [Candidatus Omnitrophica bacterium]|nr:UDP-N-acetylmuramoyl-L-alanine--D-glutamate ligase [Candidatus Omnitrophota bacterium]